MEKIDYLIEYLLKESGRENFDYSNRDKKSLYRALVNVRQANPISDEFLSKNKGKIDKVIFNLWSGEDVMIYEQNIK